MGRHTTYNQKKADQICELIADGVFLREICRMEGMPAWRTVYNWIAANIEFEARFARARELGYDAIAEDTLIMVDKALPEKNVTEEIQHRKLKVDARLKMLAKWSPKYSDRQQIDLKGSIDIATTIIAARRRAGGVK